MEDIVQAITGDTRAGTEFKDVHSIGVADATLSEWRRVS